METQVIAAIRESGAKPSDVMIFSFRREVVEKIARLEARLPTTWLIGDLSSLPELAEAAGRGMLPNIARLADAAPSCA